MHLSLVLLFRLSYFLINISLGIIDFYDDLFHILVVQ